MPRKKDLKIIGIIIGVILLTLYLGGIMIQVFNLSQSIAQTNSGWITGGKAPLINSKKVTTVSLAPWKAWAANFKYGFKGTFLATPLVAFLSWAIYQQKKKMGSQNDERGFEYADKGTYGTSKWLSLADAEKRRLDVTSAKNATGVIVGEVKDKVLSIPPNGKNGNTRYNRNIAVIGPPGSGKSFCFVGPAILQYMKLGESMVITDTKGDLCRDYRNILEKNGYVVKMLNLKDVENSDAWNCLGEIQGGNIEINTQIFSSTIIQNTKEQGSSGNSIYDDGPMNLLTALLLYVGNSASYGGKRTLPEAYRLLTTKSELELKHIFDSLPDTDPAKPPYNLFLSASGNLAGNIIQGLGTRMQALQSKLISEVLSHDGIDLGLPGQQKCAYFLIIPDQYNTFSFVSSLFYRCLIIKLVNQADRNPDKRLKIPVNLVLDEFVNIGVLPKFADTMSTVRSRQINISIIFQNIVQLKNTYGLNGWQNLLGVCDTLLVLGCNDKDTADYISWRSGTASINVETNKYGKPTFSPLYVPMSYDKSEGVGKRAVIDSGEAVRQGVDEVIIGLKGEDFLKAQKFPLTDHPQYKNLTPFDTTAYIPDWRRELEAELKAEIEEAKAASKPQEPESSPEVNSPKAPANPNATSGNYLHAMLKEREEQEKEIQAKTKPKPKKPKTVVRTSAALKDEVKEEPQKEPEQEPTNQLQEEPKEESAKEAVQVQTPQELVKEEPVNKENEKEETNVAITFEKTEDTKDDEEQGTMFAELLAPIEKPNQKDRKSQLASF